MYERAMDGDLKWIRTSRLSIKNSLSLRLTVLPTAMQVKHAVQQVAGEVKLSMPTISIEDEATPNPKSDTLSDTIPNPKGDPEH